MSTYLLCMHDVSAILALALAQGHGRFSTSITRTRSTSHARSLASVTLPKVIVRFSKGPVSTYTFQENDSMVFDTYMRNPIIEETTAIKVER